MAFRRACDLDEVWEGEMTQITVDGHEVLLIHLERGELRAFAARCPHQSWPLVEGELDGSVLVCGAHGWTFDARSGAGVNPADCALGRYAVEVRDDAIWIDVGAEATEERETP
jgi:toluene monooxygenase system ferredoxin subunit